MRCNHCGWHGADADLVRDVAADEPEDGAADVCPQCKRIGDLQDIGLPAASAIPVPTTKAEYIALLDLAVELGKKLNIAWEDAFRAARGQPAAPVAQEPVGEVFTMEPLDGSGDVRSHVLLTKPLPAGTKLYVAPVAAQTQPDTSEDAYVIDRMGKLLAEIAVIVRGQELARHRHGYADLPERVAALKAVSVVAQAQPVVSLQPDMQRETQRGAESAQDREEADLLDWLREETCDLRCINEPTGDDDYEVRWIVIRHHMARPHEREIGRSFTDDPRDAIRAARAAKGPTMADLPKATVDNLVENPMTDLRQRGLARVEKTLIRE